MIPLLVLALALAPAPRPRQTTAAASASGMQGAAGQGPGPVNAKAQTVLKAAIAALGGDHYLQVKDRSANGRAYGFTSTGDLASTGTPFWVFSRFPDAQRIEVGKKRDVIELINGDKGWEITYKGVAPMQATQLTDALLLRSHSLDVVLRQWAADPKTLILDQGLNQIGTTQVESLAFYNQNGEVVTIDFALDTHLPVRSHWRRNDPLTGGHFDESILYGNWQTIGGIATPMSLERFQGDRKISQQYLDAADYAPLPDSLFTPTPLKHR